MTFPVLLKRPGAESPRLPLYYSVAANGIYQVRDTPAYRAVTRVFDVPGLVRERESLELRFPHLSSAHLACVAGFFQAVHRRTGGEALVLLFYRPEQRRFVLRVPPQVQRDLGGEPARHALHYQNLRVERALRFGTLHSHGALPAYASETDCLDECWEDGLHVVIGDLHRRVFSCEASFVANGVRFALEPQDVFDSLTHRRGRFPAEWLERVHREEAARPRVAAPGTPA